MGEGAVVLHLHFRRIWRSDRMGFVGHLSVSFSRFDLCALSRLDEGDLKQTHQLVQGGLSVHHKQPRPS